MKIPSPLLPKEHGAWAVLLAPLILGASAADKWHGNVVVLAIAALAFFFSYVPLQIILRHHGGTAQAPQRLRAAYFWATVDLVLGGLVLLPLFRQKLWLLLVIGAAAAFLFIIHFLWMRRHAKGLVSDFIAMAGLALTAPAAYYVSTARIDQTAVLLWLFSILFFGCSAVYVHMKIRATTLKKTTLSWHEKLIIGKLNLLYHLAVLLVIGVFTLTLFTPRLAFAAFVPITLHAVYGTLKLSAAVRFKRLGFILVGHTLIFMLLLGLAHARPPAQMESGAGSVGTYVASSSFDLHAAVRNAQRGDTIFVPAGVYAGNFIIDKKLTLIGRDWPVLNAGGKGSCLTITADSCTITGFVVTSCGGMLVDEDAGILIKSHHNVIAGNRLRDILFGIYLFQADHNTIVENHIVGRKRLELGERGSGIHLWNSRGNRLIGNVITDVRDGFYIQNANHTFIARNEVFGVRYGLHYMYADSNIFLQNEFHHNVAGAAIMYSRGIRMRHNVFAHNRGFSSFGILFQDCHEAVADSNVIVNNAVGMFFEASTGNQFRRNLVAQNDVALQMYQNSVQNLFSENNFTDNLSPLSLVGKRTETHWSENGRGNYWSTYEGYDLDHDGIGDVPMKIQNVFDYLEGRAPNLRLYLYSPASQALAAATKAFPIIDINREADEHPLMRPVDLRRASEVRLGLTGSKYHLNALRPSLTSLNFGE